MSAAILAAGGALCFLAGACFGTGLACAAAVRWAGREQEDADQEKFIRNQKKKADTPVA